MATLQDLLKSTTLDETALLRRRMIALHLDTEAWARCEPAMFSELKSLCVACTSRQECAYDLAMHLDEPTWSDWRDYCPNAARLSMLGALQAFLRSGVPIEQAVERFADHPQTAPVETD
jgi:hypothetical protein